MLDRSTKTFFAVSLLVIALLTGINAIVSPAGVADWTGPVAVITLAASVAFWLWMWQEDRAAQQESDEAEASLQVPQRQEWVIAQEPAPALTGNGGAVSAAPEAPTEAEPVAETPSEPAPVEAEPEPELQAEPQPVTPEPEPEPEPVAAEPEPELQAEPEPEPPAPEPATAPAEPVTADAKAADEPDDLQRIEGIGPVYRDALMSTGYNTFEKIAAANRDELEAALKQAGASRIPASIETWAEQAGYAARGDWEGLNKLQKELDGGRRT